ncbi:ABC transporter substrate-binding protein [Haloplanus sp. GCM10025708]|uniref:ABC transporter substrate-binding protein n=1 Tax=Haloferacaceae TaxID=1644056 RepID=UPI003615EB36
MPTPTRRTFIGATGTTILTGLAGCAGSGGGGTATPTSTAGGSSGDDTSTPTSTAGDSGSEADIKIGVLLPFTGEYDWVGANVYPVTKMLVDEINANGGIDGRNVGLVRGDTEATVDASVSAAQKLVNVDKVDLIVGPTSLTFTGVKDLIEENGIPVISPSAGTTELDDVGGEFIFRTVPSDSLGGRAISKAIRNEQYNGITDYSKMGLMVGNAPALQSFKAPIKSSFEEYGGTVTNTLDYATGKSSYQAEVSKMLQSNPEIICLVGTPEDSAKIMRAAFQAGYEGNWFVTQDQTNAEFLSLIEPQISDGILGLVEADNPEAVEAGRIEQFTADVKAATGSEPGIFAKNTYDGVNIGTLAMVAAAQDGDVTRESIAANIPTVAKPPEQDVTTYSEGASAIAEGTDVNYEGLVGPCDFNEYGDISSPFAIMQADGTEWNQIATLPASEL